MAMITTSILYRFEPLKVRNAAMPQLTPYPFPIYKLTFPSVRKEPPCLEAYHLNGVSFRLLLTKLRRQNIVENTLLQCIIPFYLWKRRFRESQVIHTDGINLLEEPVYPHLFQSREHKIPVHILIFVLHKKKPIEQLPQCSFGPGEMLPKMTNQENGIQCRRRKVYLALLHLQRPVESRYSLEQSLQLT